jgi:ribosomal protein S6
MTEAEAVKAYKEMLPCETTVADMQNWEKRKLGYPIHLVYKGPGALLSRVFLVFQTGENSTSEYPIEKLELVKSAECGV